MKPMRDYRVSSLRVARPATPPLYRAYASENHLYHPEQVGVFTTLHEAAEALDAQLDDLHEGIAFEADHHHHALDTRYKQFSFIEEF